MDPIKNSPFTVGLSLPARLDYQYIFSSLSDMDLGRQALEAYEDNVRFRELRSSRCQGVLQFLVRAFQFTFTNPRKKSNGDEICSHSAVLYFYRQEKEENKRGLQDMVSRLQQIKSQSDTIPEDLICLYDIYLPSLMEGFALRNVGTVGRYILAPEQAVIII